MRAEEAELLSSSVETSTQVRGGSEEKNPKMSHFSPGRKQTVNNRARFRAVSCHCHVARMPLPSTDPAPFVPGCFTVLTNTLLSSCLPPDGYSTIDQRDKDCKYNTSDASSDLTEREPLKVRLCDAACLTQIERFFSLFI